MIDFEKIECIIPFKLISQDRFENLKTILFYFKTYFPQIKITIVEQDIFNKVRYPNVLFIKSNEEFNKGWILNCAAKKSDKEFLLFWDADMIVHPDSLLECLNKFSDYDTVKPYNTYLACDVNPYITTLFRKNMDFSILSDAKIRTGCPYSGGIFGMKKDIFLNIGGFFEDFKSWGCEDEAIFIKIKNFTKYIDNENKGYHLFHTRGTADRAFHNLYDENVSLLGKYRDMNLDDLKIYCDIQKNNIGKYGE